MTDNLNILEKANNLLPFMVSIRRKIHENPELGMEEYETAELICEHLDKMGIKYRSGVGKTGIAGLIEGKAGKGKCIGLRADMDALPLPEQKSVPYASKRPGIMHACGHDGHVAMLLGAAGILEDLKEEFPGSVKLVFQPAEECIGGAIPMIKDGVMENPSVDSMIAIHMDSGSKSGVMLLLGGPCHAAQNDFEITVTGKGGHAAVPHKSVDTILIASKIVVELHHIVSRHIDPLEPAVLTVGIIEGGTKSNIIPDRVFLKGTIRYLNDKVGEELRYWLEKISKGTAEMSGGECSVKFIPGYIVGVNDENFTEKIWNYLEGFLPEGYLKREKHPMMGSEDFSYFASKVPSVFMGLGGRGEGEETAYPHHHPKFDFDEKAMAHGAAVLAHVAIKFLNENF
jgi:amidohydrolase